MSSSARQIERLQRRAADDPRVIGLAGGLPSEAQFPKRALGEAFLTTLRQPHAPALQYGWTEGSELLREVVARRLRARGAAVRADDVIITSGAQQALSIAFDLTCRAGARVGVAPETYPAALELLRARRLVPVVGGAAAVSYAMPALGNPSGRALRAEERKALLSGSGVVVEDDAYADLRFDGPAPRPLIAEAPARVLHVGTFSKTLCPGLRLGWLVTPPRLRRRALELKQGSDLQSGSLAQAIVETYLGGGARRAAIDFDGRVHRLRLFYAARASSFMRAVRAQLPEWRVTPPEGGFAVWAEAPARPGRPIDEIALLSAAVSEGVVFDPGSLFRAEQARTPLALRLCFSSAPVGAFAEGLGRLARAWRRAARRRR